MQVEPAKAKEQGGTTAIATLSTKWCWDPWRDGWIQIVCKELWILFCMKFLKKGMFFNQNFFDIFRQCLTIF